MTKILALRAFLAAALLWAASAVPGFAQTSPNWTYGFVPTPAQWNAQWASKQDYLGAPPLLTTGGTMTGRLVTSASNSTRAGFNLPHGASASSPVNGDLWTTTLGLFVQINGVTVGPLVSGQASNFAGTSPITVSFPAGVVTYACATCGVTGQPLSQFASTTSAQLRGIISDETGSGVLVFGTGPTLTGVTVTTSFTATGLVGLTNLASQAANTVVMNGTGSAASPVAYSMPSCVGAANALQWTSGTGFTCSAIVAAAGSIAIGTTTITSGTSGRILYDNAGILGEATVTGSLGSVVLSNSPTLVTPVLGVAIGTSLALNGCTIGTSAICTNGAVALTSATATALAVGANLTNPAFLVDASAASQATGIKVTGNAAAGGAGISVISSGTNESLSLDAKGSGGIFIGGVSTGAITLSRATTLSAALTYGGVTLSNSVTGTGSMVLATSPSISGLTVTSSFTATGLVTFGALASGAVATSSEYYAGTSSKLVQASVMYPSETTTTYGATTTFDFSTFINTAVTLTGNITTMTLSNVTAGKAGSITFIQDATGSRTTVWNSIFKFAGGVSPSLSTAANAVDILFYSCRSATYCAASLNKAFN